MTANVENIKVGPTPFRLGKWIGVGAMVLLVGTLAASAASYNRLIALDQEVKSQWAEVENVYQRRADLVPNLVSTVKAAAAFERDTFTAVTEARARVGQLSTTAATSVTSDPTAFAKFQDAQNALSSSLSRLMVVVERYPDLRATQNFRDLQSQLEGTENRIAVARMRFNEAARTFNTQRNGFPTVVLVGFFGSRFEEKVFFKADPGAAVVPKVDFGTR